MMAAEEEARVAALRCRQARERVEKRQQSLLGEVAQQVIDSDNDSSDDSSDDEGLQIFFPKRNTVRPMDAPRSSPEKGRKRN